MNIKDELLHDMKHAETTMECVALAKAFLHKTYMMLHKNIDRLDNLNIESLCDIAEVRNSLEEYAGEID